MLLTLIFHLRQTDPVILWEWMVLGRWVFPMESLWSWCFCDPKEGPQTMVSNFDIYKHMETLIHSINVNLPCFQQGCLPLWFGPLGVPENPWELDPGKYSQRYRGGKCNLLHWMHPARKCREVETNNSSSFMKDFSLFWWFWDPLS